ncbi:MAG: glycerol kinase GlpK [Proteobacteria bacterium]|nr:glycerol kinase GlpK [Pseudomonadota bacterium]
MIRFVGAIDQGTTSTRFILFTREGLIHASAQKEHRQILPRPGWVEHDALEIWRNTCEVMTGCLSRAGVSASELAAIGITNQRETCVLWEARSGQPVHHAIVWQDTRTDARVAEYAASGGIDRFRARTGLPLASYFSALKLQWLLDEVPQARARAERGELKFGTLDSWLTWNLTGGAQGGAHVTDVSNASRTQLMSLARLDWDEQLLAEFRIPRAVLPRIVSSSEVQAPCTQPLPGVPVSGLLGDQQAALVGQACLAPGEAKNTYGTGCFLLMNTGDTPVASRAGLITTVAYRFEREPARYALEGSIAISGALVQWLRDNLRLIGASAEIESLAAQAPDNGDVYFVPAFSGLYAPYWRPDARGAIVGLTRFAAREHIARAALEATAYQTRDVLEAMRQDAGLPMSELRVDGGMTGNELLMQFQADLLDVLVIRPRVRETTALGAAYAAGLAVGFWKDIAEIRHNWREDRRWLPRMAPAERERLYARWRKAVEKSMDWV